MRQRQSSEMTETQYPVKSMGAASRGESFGAGGRAGVTKKLSTQRSQRHQTERNSYRHFLPVKLL